MVHRIVLQVWGLVPLGHVNLPPITHQAPGVGSRAYHWLGVLSVRSWITRMCVPMPKCVHCQTPWLLYLFHCSLLCSYYIVFEGSVYVFGNPAGINDGWWLDEVRTSDIVVNVRCCQYPAWPVDCHQKSFACVCVCCEYQPRLPF